MATLIKEKTGAGSQLRGLVIIMQEAWQHPGRHGVGRSGEFYNLIARQQKGTASLDLELV